MYKKGKILFVVILSFFNVSSSLAQKGNLINNGNISSIKFTSLYTWPHNNNIIINGISFNQYYGIPNTYYFIHSVPSWGSAGVFEMVGCSYNASYFTHSGMPYFMASQNVSKRITKNDSASLKNSFDIITDNNFAYLNKKNFCFYSFILSDFDSFDTRGYIHFIYDTKRNYYKTKRTYFTNKLKEQLLVGKTYRFSFFVQTENYVGDTFYTNKNITNQSYYLASNGLGVAFTNAMPIQNHGQVLDIKTQWQSPEIINYKKDIWKQFTFEFIADSAYEYMTIGNFLKNDALNIKEPVWYPKAPAKYDDYLTYDYGRTSAFIYDSFTLIKVITPPKIIGNKIACVGSSQNYKSTSGKNTEWFLEGQSTPYHVGDSINIVITKSTYIIAMHDSLYDTLSVTALNYPKSDLPKQISFCFKTDNKICLQFNIPNISFKWQDGTTSNCTNIQQQGQYIVFMQNGACFANDTLNAKELQIPQFNIIQRDTPCLDGSSFTVLRIQPDTFPSILWLPGGSASSQLTINDTNSRKITVTGSNGCITALKYKPVNGCNMVFYVPNSFSPDNNGINDGFNVKGSFIGKINMRIYNTWGEMIFQTNDLNEGWDGTYQNAVCPQGNYLVIIELQSLTNQNNNKPTQYWKGMVQLLR